MKDAGARSSAASSRQLKGAPTQSDGASVSQSGRVGWWWWVRAPVNRRVKEETLDDDVVQTLVERLQRRSVRYDLIPLSLTPHPSHSTRLPVWSRCITTITLEQEGTGKTLVHHLVPHTRCQLECLKSNSPHPTRHMEANTAIHQDPTWATTNHHISSNSSSSQLEAAVVFLITVSPIKEASRVIRPTHSNPHTPSIRQICRHRSKLQPLPHKLSHPPHNFNIPQCNKLNNFINSSNSF